MTILILHMSQKGYVRRVLGKGLVVSGNHRKRREGKADELQSGVCAPSPEAQQGNTEVKTSSIEVPRSEPLDQDTADNLSFSKWKMTSCPL